MTRFIMAAFCLLLAGCAGGGGDGTPVPVPVPVPVSGPVTPPSEVIDTLNWVLSKYPDKVRQDKDGGYLWSQVIDLAKQRAYLVKRGPWETSVTADHWLGYTWDENHIYFAENNEADAVGQPAAKVYGFSPGAWFKRSMAVGDVLDGSIGGPIEQMITFYDRGTCQVSSTSRYDMKTVLESHLPKIDLGGDLGEQDVIVLRIEQGTYSEKEIYSSQHGLVRWQHCTLNGALCDQTATFNMITSLVAPKIDMSRACDSRLR